MKKLLMLALLVAAGSVFNTTSAQSKKKGKQNAKCSVECKEGAVVLTSPSDTLSYAAGMVYDTWFGRVSCKSVWCYSSTDARLPAWLASGYC